MTESIDDLRVLVANLEEENRRLRRAIFAPSESEIIHVPDAMRSQFAYAEAAMRELFGRVQIDPARALIAVGEDRYLLIRASAFAIDFFDTLVELYSDRGAREAAGIARSFLFDIAHTIGLHDARTINTQLGSEDPLQKLTAGPVRFAYTGWSHVDIHPSSRPVADAGYRLIYQHSYSFEADAFLRAGRHSDTPVCIMSAGYSSGWCEASFGMSLTAVEIECKARGDAACVFVMAPPEHVAERIREHRGPAHADQPDFDIPTYFEHRHAEERVRASLQQLEEAQSDLLRRERLATVGLLVSGVAHEVNTPLGVAVTAAGVVGEELDALRVRFEAGALNKGDLRAFFARAGQAEEMVRTNLERAAAEITKFKRVSVDHVSEEKRRIDVAEHVEQTFDHLRPLSRKAGLTVTVTRDGDLRCVTYPGAIAQILTNFLTNTTTHGMRDDGPTQVRVDVSRSGDSVQLTYRDDGRGMSEETRAKAFQPFFTTKRGSGGSGLGLHIVQSLVAEVLHGSIELTTSPGTGACFVVTFPVTTSLTSD